MGRLAETFESLKKADGSPDLALRKSELDGLIPFLTHAEITQLRSQLNALRVPCDIISKFPIEVNHLIFKHLDLEDIIRARRVSRDWDDFFDSPAVCVDTIKWHCQPLWERDFEALSVEERESDSMNAHALLQAEAKERGRRRRGQYRSMAMYCNTRDDGSSIKSGYQYCNGRVAYMEQDDLDFIMVQNLRYEFAYSYRSMMDEPIGPWLLSDSYLLGALKSPARLVAWRMRYGHRSLSETDSIRLPSNTLTISAYHEQVGIVTVAYEVLIWKVGGPSRLVDTATLYNELDHLKLNYVVVFFHPYNKDHFFVVLRASTGHYSAVARNRCRIAVLEYVEWRVESTHTFDLSCAPGPAALPIVSRLHDGLIGISNLDRYSVDDSRFPRHKKHTRKDGRKLHKCHTLHVTFDMFTKTFDVQEYQLPAWALVPGEYLPEREPVWYWRDQVLCPIYVTEIKAESRPKDVADILVATFGLSDKWIADETKRKVQVRWYEKADGPNGDIKVSMMPRDKMACDTALTYCLIGDANHAREVRDSFHADKFREFGDQSRIVRGDDDFVVLFGNYGFLVWCFDASVSLARGNRVHYRERSRGPTPLRVTDHRIKVESHGPPWNPQREHLANLSSRAVRAFGEIL